MKKRKRKKRSAATAERYARGRAALAGMKREPAAAKKKR
jgi:hypothetical protein